MLFKHYSDFNGAWLWDKFSAEELSCNCCGEYYHDPYSLDLLRAARSFIDVPFIIESGHRCVKHNADEGGVKSSQHLKIAFDIHTELDPVELHHLLNSLYPNTGGLGYYNWGCHQDFRREKARW
ncbi:MAG: serine/threonine protein kinase [Planctomycetes bacterium]|nr:serine/threonine protein kinase [Planctomycetota bacterium]